jgi:hypothetical protein
MRKYCLYPIPKRDVHELKHIWLSVYHWVVDNGSRSSSSHSDIVLMKPWWDCPIQPSFHPPQSQNILRWNWNFLNASEPGSNAVLRHSKVYDKLNATFSIPYDLRRWPEVGSKGSSLATLISSGPHCTSPISSVHHDIVLELRNCDTINTKSAKSPTHYLCQGQSSGQLPTGIRKATYKLEKEEKGQLCGHISMKAQGLCF